MKNLNREKTTKIFLFLTSILSIVLFLEGMNNIKSSIIFFENQGGFDIYPINYPDVIVQEWWYYYISDILFSLFPVMILILSIVSIFVKNRAIEILIIAQTFLTLLLEVTAYHKIAVETIGYYKYIGISLLITLTIIIISVIWKKSIFVFYIIGVILLIAKYIDVCKFWYGQARESVSLLSWLNMYGIKYTVIAILGFIILLLKTPNINPNVQPAAQQTSVR